MRNPFTLIPYVINLMLLLLLGGCAVPYFFETYPKAQKTEEITGTIRKIQADRSQEECWIIDGSTRYVIINPAFVRAYEGKVVRATVVLQTPDPATCSRGDPVLVENVEKIK